MSIDLLRCSMSTAGLPISETHKKNNLPANQKGYDNSETTVGKLSTRKIQICCDNLFKPFLVSFLKHVKTGSQTLLRCLGLLANCFLLS